MQKMTPVAPRDLLLIQRGSKPQTSEARGHSSATNTSSTPKSGPLLSQRPALSSSNIVIQQPQNQNHQQHRQSISNEIKIPSFRPAPTTPKVATLLSAAPHAKNSSEPVRSGGIEQLHAVPITHPGSANHRETGIQRPNTAQMQQMHQKNQQGQQQQQQQQQQQRQQEQRQQELSPHSKVIFRGGSSVLGTVGNVEKLEQKPLQATSVTSSTVAAAANGSAASSQAALKKRQREELGSDVEDSEEGEDDEDDEDDEDEEDDDEDDDSIVVPDEEDVEMEEQSSVDEEANPDVFAKELSKEAEKIIGSGLEVKCKNGRSLRANPKPNLEDMKWKAIVNEAHEQDEKKEIIRNMGRWSKNSLYSEKKHLFPPVNKGMSYQEVKNKYDVLRKDLGMELSSSEDEVEEDEEENMENDDDEDETEEDLSQESGSDEESSSSEDE